MKNHVWMYKHKCAWCKCEFESKPEYGWRAKCGKEKYVYFCRYDHMRAWEKAHTKVKEPSERDRAILQGIREGKTYERIAEELDISACTVRRVRDKWMF